MTYQIHPHVLFESIPGDEFVVRRYLSFPKLVSMLQTKSLYFAAAAKMDDPWEGQFGAANLSQRQSNYFEHADNMSAAMEGMTTRMPSRTYLNCWSGARHETVSMWERYSSENAGVMLETSWGSLTDSITSSETVFGGLVAYKNYAIEPIPEGNSIATYAYKRHFYADELEARLVVLNYEGLDRPENDGNLAPGISIALDLDRLDFRVLTSPSTPDWVTDMVKQTVSGLAPGVEVSASEIGHAPPRYVSTSRA